MTRFAELAGCRIHYDDVGQGDVVFLLHGLGLDLRMWDDQVPALAKHHRVVRMDLHGFGKSSPVSGPFSHGDIIAQLLAHLGIDRAHVVGLSYGGLIAAEFIQEHPAVARSLTLVDTDISGLSLKTLVPSFRKIFGIGPADVEGAKKMWFEHELFEPAREHPAVAARLKEMVHDYSGWLFAHSGSGLERKPSVRTADVLKDFKVPALVVIGERDAPDFHDIADEVVRRLPGARKVVLEGVGHMCNMEDPKTFNRVLIEFLETTSES